MRLFSAGLFFLSVAVTAQPAKVIESWNADPALKNALIGVSITDTKGKTILDHNAHLALSTASSLKIVTTAAALRILGRTFRYETKIFHTGTFDSLTGTIHGDIIISGSGDPTLQSENFSGTSERITDKWAAALKAKGVKAVTGRIVGDASVYSREIPGSWIWEDISNYYGAGTSGLSFRDNKFSVFFTSGAGGTHATITKYSPVYMSKSYSVTSHVLASGASDEAYAYGDPWSFSKHISGSIPPGKKDYEVEVSLPDPALLCAEEFCLSLKNTGIACKTDSVFSNYDRPATAFTGQLLYTHLSPTLDKIVFYANSRSINHYAESIIRTLGSGDPQKGIFIVKSHFAQQGLDTTELFMKDGSGLSRLNTMTPRSQTSLLALMAADSINHDVFRKSLPAAGRDGSMAFIGKGTKIENNLRAKTGYITRVRAYCGYLKSASGKDLVFSVLMNNYLCTPKEARLKIEKLLVSMSEL